MAKKQYDGRMVIYPWGGEIEHVYQLAEQLDGFYKDWCQGKVS